MMNIVNRMVLTEDWVETNSGMKSSVITLGDRISDSWDKLANSHLIIIIPGNPGLGCFYTEFMTILQSSLTDPTTPIWAFSHVGHVSDKPSLLPLDKTYTLEEQVTHKLELLDKFVPPSTTITLIGHSVGCKIILDMEARNTRHKYHKFYFLFPMLEQMLATPSGSAIWAPVNVFRIPIVLLLALINVILPDWLLKQILGKVYPEAPKQFVTSASRFRNPNYLNNCFMMAKDEMEVVLDLDVDTIRNMVGRLHLYYGTTDGWCPLAYRDRMLKIIPELETEARVCDRGIAHAFVEKSGLEMANIVGDWMMGNK